MKRKFPFAVGQIHHVYNRGVAKASICNNEKDLWRFLQGLCLFNDIQSSNHVLWHLERDQKRLTMNVLKDYVVVQGEQRQPLVRILAYCIMGNHYHLLVEEICEGGITKFMQKFGVGYANYFNKKYDRVGSLFQGKFKNVLVDTEDYLAYLLVYINVLNPAEFVNPHWKERGIQDIDTVLKFTAEYPWSSHQDYLGKRGSLILDRGILANMFPTSEDYLELVKMVIRAKKYEEIKELTID